jgi:thioredoxin reductase
VKAKLACASCHGKADEGTKSFVTNARSACADCHGPHPSTREGHRRLAAAGDLTCVSCHTIHGPQSGVRLPDEGVAVRYGTWGEVPLPDLSFHAERTVLVPTIPVRACLSCPTDDARDPLARCRSGAGGADLEPTVCFDEHRSALPPGKGPVAEREPAPTRPRRGPAREPPRPKRDDKAVCSDQHFDDRSFAWEVARGAVHEVPVVSRPAAAGTPLGWLGAGGAGAALGYSIAAALAFVTARRRRAAQDAQLSVSPTTKRLPVIDTSTCLGCYACVDACPYGVLEVERYVAVVARPDACCGLTLCEQRCPNGSLKMGEAGATVDRPRIHPTLEAEDAPGVFLCGDVTGVPLIKNAILQGSRAAEAAHAKLAGRSKDAGAVDVCVVGAGPAGISAALRLKELGTRTIVVEQGGVAQSIQSFPRGKLVFDQPLELPVAGKLWLKESSKEELLLHWMRVVRREALEIREQTRMSGVERDAQGRFLVRALGPDGAVEIPCRAVILAIGQRGSPRHLPVAIPPEAESRVFYHLADARSLAGQKVVIVGLGDTAMETAAALAAQPRTSVTILHRGATYSRGQPRNIREIERLRKAGRLRLHLETEVTEVGAGFVLATSAEDGRRERIPFDALFVLIGSIPPWDTLRRAGVRSTSEAHVAPLEPLS